MKKNQNAITTLAIILAVMVTSLIGFRIGRLLFSPKSFDGERAYQDAYYQLALGPRTPGSQAHAAMPDYITNQLAPYGWKVEIVESFYQGHHVNNITATRGEGDAWIILGAHYDSRFYADHDPNPDQHSTPVPGANDGASGVAVLLELGRSLPRDLAMKTTLLFIDVEDQGNIDGWEWILGSSSYAQNLETLPNAVVIVDMIGDQDLNIYKEHNSDVQIMDELWSIAKDLGYQKQWINEYKYRMIDDHIPFKQRGIPAVDLIDFDYPYWHTTSDTLDKISAQSLEIVGKTLYIWITGYNRQ